MGMNLPNQFVNWHLVYNPEKPKPDKVPFDPLTGYPIDPHDPRNWKTYDQALASGHPVGFILTANDPYFFIDMDDCRVGDGWSPDIVAIFNEFAGAAVEISQSATGLHIVGRCDQQAVADRRNKFKHNGLAFEFYTQKRFIAFGPYGWSGNFDLDWTAQILRFVPKREILDGQLNAFGPVQEWTGPTDDAELINKAMNGRGSIAASFGSRASFKDLWTADASILCQIFKSPTGDTYDRSSADAALMSHLAFWTGKDAGRMDRLFRTSGLMRPKYEARPDYRRDTINNAIRLCKKVYDLPRAPIIPHASPTTGEPVVSDEFLNVAEQVEHFKGCVYIRDSHRVMIPGGMMLRSEQFNASYGGKIFQMSMDNTAPTKKAFEAFTENRSWIFPKANSTCFRPSMDPGTVVNGDANVYFPIEIDAQPGDITPFLDLIYRLLPDENDRNILLSYCAAVEQHKGVKFQWCPVLQGVEGNGKTIISRCLAYTIGVKYTHWPSAEDLGNPFNSYLENKLLIAVEEVHMNGRRELLDTLKPLITNDRVETQPKGVDKRMVDNYSNWIMNTNHKDAVLKTQNDRRYSIFFTAQQSLDDIIRFGMGGDYFPRLYEWLRSGGYSHVAHFFRTYQIPEQLNPAGSCHRAPYTSTTAQAIEASLGKAEQQIIESIEIEDAGFRNGWVSSVAVENLMKEKGIKMSPQRAAEMMEALNFKRVVRSHSPIMQEGGKRPILYIRRDLYRPEFNVDDYIIAQGYATAKRQMATIAHLPSFKGVA